MRYPQTGRTSGPFGPATFHHDWPGGRLHRLPPADMHGRSLPVSGKVSRFRST
jgi:hypothetical protein